MNSDGLSSELAATRVLAPVWTRELPVALRAMSHIPMPDDAPRFERPVRPHGIDPARRERSRRSLAAVRCAPAALCAMDIASISSPVCGAPT